MDFSGYHDGLLRLETELYFFEGDDQDLIDLLLDIEEFESMCLEGLPVCDR